MRQLAVGAELGRMPLAGEEAMYSLQSRGKEGASWGREEADMRRVADACQHGAPNWRATLLHSRFLEPPLIRDHSSLSFLRPGWEVSSFWVPLHVYPHQKPSTT